MLLQHKGQPQQLELDTLSQYTLSVLLNWINVMK